MQVSYNLLKEYIDIELNPNELADRLSMNGIVAERKKKIFEGVEGVVVGEIRGIKAHEKNKTLSVCNVDINNKQLEVVYWILKVNSSEGIMEKKGRDQKLYA